MNTTFLNTIYFCLPLIAMGILTMYAFKININILVPSTIMLLLFVIITIISPYTLNKFETKLFTIYCIIQLVTLIGGILLMLKQEILWKHFFVSLPFQLFYWIFLFYYGGLQFTHKF